MLTWPTDSADIFRREWTAGLLRGEAREEVVDRLRRATKQEARIALEEAGLRASSASGRRRFGPALRLLPRTSALSTLTPDADALHVHAYVQLAARRYQESLRTFERVLHAAPPGRIRDASALGTSIVLSFLKRPYEASEWCWRVLNTCEPEVARHSALTLLLQGARRSSRRDAATGFTQLLTTWDKDATREAARLLGRYLPEEERQRNVDTLATIGTLGAKGREVLAWLGEFK